MTPSLPDALSRAFGQHQDVLRDSSELTPDALPLPFNPIAGLDDLAWNVQLGGWMVSDDLQELTNGLNNWKGALRSWHAWVKVLGDLDEDTRWATEWDLVEPLAFMCMFMPSSVRDRLTFVVTNAMHQVLMTIDPARKDSLLGDAAIPGESPQKYPTRRDKEKQLADMVSRWPEGKQFMQLLRRLDGKDYRAATGDFRNRASHSIAPRFTLGFVRAVTRTREQATQMELQPNGFYLDVPIPGKAAISYGFGGTPPLDMDQARAANLSQFEVAKQCFHAYVALLRVATAGIAKRRPPMKPESTVEQEVGAASSPRGAEPNVQAQMVGSDFLNSVGSGSADAQSPLA